MSHPYSDPFHSGLVQLTPSQQLMNRNLLARRGVPRMMGDEAGAYSPLGGIGDSVGAVLGAAGYGRPQPERKPVESDADAPSQGVVSDSQGNMSHVRNSDNGTTVTPVQGQGAVPDGE